MTTARRFLWGGIGGLAPILATFLILEADIIGRYLAELGRGGSALTVIGYVVRVVGLFIAIPAIAAYNILRNRVQRLVLEVGIVSENLMSRFENVSASK